MSAKTEDRRTPMPADDAAEETSPGGNGAGEVEPHSGRRFEPSDGELLARAGHWSLLL